MVHFQGRHSFIFPPIGQTFSSLTGSTWKRGWQITKGKIWKMLMDSPGKLRVFHQVYLQKNKDIMINDMYFQCIYTNNKSRILQAKCSTSLFLRWLPISLIFTVILSAVWLYVYFLLFFAPFGKNRLMNPDERYEAITGHPQKILQKGVHSIVRFPVMKPLWFGRHWGFQSSMAAIFWDDTTPISLFYGWRLVNQNKFIKRCYTFIQDIYMYTMNWKLCIVLQALSTILRSGLINSPSNKYLECRGCLHSQTSKKFPLHPSDPPDASSSRARMRELDTTWELAGKPTMASQWGSHERIVSSPKAYGHPVETNIKWINKNQMYGTRWLKFQCLLYLILAR